MREKIQHSNFSKSVAVFLIVPIMLVTSFSFPRPAHADLALFIAVITTSLTLGLSLVVIDATTCYVDVFWSCSNANADGSVTAIDISPTASLSASPTTIDSGETSTLTWNSTNATSCAALGGFLTGDAISGTASTGALTSTQNYQVSCTGPGGIANSNTATVTVIEPTASIIAAPPRVVLSGGGGGGGGTTTISWNATNVNGCTVTRNGVIWQTLTADGSRTVSGSVLDTVTGQTAYALSCTNNSSLTAVAASARQIVNVVTSFQEF